MSTLVNENITSMRALVDAIDSFLTANGFTQDSAPTGTTSGSAHWHCDELYVGASWTTQAILELRQALGYSGGGTDLAGYNTEADFFGVNLTTAAVYGFANNAATASERYAHFVVEFNKDGRFIHFGFGFLEKYNDWEGGAYVYGGEWSTTGTAESEPYNTNHRVLLDGNHTATANTVNLATMTIRNYRNQPANGDYLIFTEATGTPSNDTPGNGVMKASGYARHGPWPTAMLHLRGNPNNAFLPLIPVEVAAHGNGSGSSTDRELLGRMRDVRVCNIGNIQPKEIISLGGETWRFFPWAQKILSAGTDAMASRNAGVAYRIV